MPDADAISAAESRVAEGDHLPVTVTAPATDGSRGALVAVSLALFCIQVDFFALNLALPDMARAFHVGTRDIQWTISAYMLSLGSLFILAGRIGDIFGRRRALLVGIGLFGIASAGCALAPSLGVLVALRVLQGAGAAVIFPAGWGSLQTVVAFVLAGLLLATFLVLEPRVRVPLVDLALFRNLPYVLVRCMGAISNIGYAVTIFGATLYLHLVRGLSPLTAGVVFLAPAVLVALSGPLGARLGKHLRPAAVMAGAGLVSWIGPAGAHLRSRLGGVRACLRRRRARVRLGMDIRQRRNAGRRAARARGPRPREFCSPSW